MGEAIPRWSGPTRKAIQRWAAALLQLQRVLFNKDRARFQKAVGRLERLASAPLSVKLRRGAACEPGFTVAEQFGRDVCAAAVVPGPQVVESWLLTLHEHYGLTELAERLTRVHDQLFPEDAGIAAAHLLALRPRRRDDGLEALCAIVQDESRNGRSRARAFRCMEELNAFGLEDPYSPLEGGNEYCVLDIRLGRACDGAVAPVVIRV